MRRFALVMGLIAGQATGCAPHTTQIGVRGTEILAHLDELNAKAVAELDTVVVAEGRATAGVRENVFFDQSVTFGGVSTNLDKLVAGCAPDGPTTCALAGHAQDLVVLRTLDAPVEHSKDSGARANTAFGAIALAGSAVGGICLTICDSNKGTLAGAAFGTALVSGLLWALTSGARD